MLPAARDAWNAAARSGWADPAAIHHPGRQARQLLEAARSSIAASLTHLGAGAIRPEDVSFAASIDQARSAALAGLPTPLTLSEVEPLALIEQAGPAGRLIGVDEVGRVDVLEFSSALAAGGTAVLQAANPEVGTTQPIADVAASGRPLLVDASQAVARMPLPTDWSVLTFGGGDVGAPGLAVLVRQTGSPWLPPESRGTGWLGGVPDVPGAVALAMALETLHTSWEAEAARAADAIDAIRSAAGTLPDVEVVGDPIGRLPHVATFSALYVSGEALVSEFARRGFAVASGSACLLDRPSHVLAAMGAYTGGNVRVSLPFGFADETVARFIDVLPAVVADTRGAISDD